MRKYSAKITGVRDYFYTELQKFSQTPRNRHHMMIGTRFSVEKSSMDRKKCAHSGETNKSSRLRIENIATSSSAGQKAIFLSDSTLKIYPHDSRSYLKHTGRRIYNIKTLHRRLFSWVCFPLLHLWCRPIHNIKPINA